MNKDWCVCEYASAIPCHSLKGLDIEGDRVADKDGEWRNGTLFKWSMVQREWLGSKIGDYTFYQQFLENSKLCL